MIDFSDDYDSERDRDAERKRSDRKKKRAVIVPPCSDSPLRDRLEADDIAWLMWCFSEESGTQHPFTYQFTWQQQEMIAALRRAIVNGGDQALAASRGEGKSMLAQRMLLKYTLAGVVKFSILFAATGVAARDALGSIKTEIESNERLLQLYPEVCVPVRSLEDTPNRAHYMVVSGHRHDTGEVYEMARAKFSWCGPIIKMPMVPGSPAAGAFIETCGLDGFKRGANKGGRRPDVAVIDDPDTEETVNSGEQARKLEHKIDRVIALLGSQRRRVARVMLTTLQNRSCVSFKFTDPKQKASWGGRRFRFLVKPPENKEMWDEFVALKMDDWQNASNTAHEFYLKNQEAMDLGAEVANPNRFTAEESTALEFYYSFVARTDADTAAAELDNDPKVDEGPEQSTISAALVASRTNRYARLVIPHECTRLVAFCDVGKLGCHWIVAAFRNPTIGFVVNHGVAEVYGTTNKVDDRPTVELAIKQALLRWREQLIETEYLDDLGKRHTVDVALVDSGTFTDAVYSFVREAGGAKTLFFPSKGIGNYRHKESEGDKRMAFAHCRLELQPESKLWLAEMDTDYWKGWVHDRFITPTLNDDGTHRIGSLSLWHPDEEDKRCHHAFGRHIAAEVWRGAQLRNGKMTKPGFVVVDNNNHWLDAMYGCGAAAEMKGIGLSGRDPEGGGSGGGRGPAPQPGPGLTTPDGRPFMATQR